jgi:hypothetical protein
MTSTSSSGARSATGQHSSGQHSSGQHSSGQHSSGQHSSGQHSSDVGGPVKHVHHGRTPAAWAGSLIALLAFIVGGIGFVIPPHPNWVVVIIGAVLLVASLIVTLVMRKFGLGAD